MRDLRRPRSRRGARRCTRRSSSAPTRSAPRTRPAGRAPPDESTVDDGDGYRVGVLGATGAVGSTILERARGAASSRPPRWSRSPPSARPGKRARVERRELLECRPLSEEAIEGLDLVLSSAGGAVSAEWAPRLVEAGAVVVDNTSFWRMHDDVPLVVAEVNPEAARRATAGSSPTRTARRCRWWWRWSRSTDAAGHRAARRLHLPGGLRHRAGGRSRSCATQSRGRARTASEARRPTVYPHRIAFNVLPQVETFKDGDDYTDRGAQGDGRDAQDPRRRRGGRDLAPPACACRSCTGHSESVNVQTREHLSPEECRELLAAAPGVVVVDDPADGALPDGDRRRRPRRGPRRPHPPRPRPRALPQPLGRRRQPAQGRGDQRRPGRRAARRARACSAQPEARRDGHRLRRGACCSSAGCSRSSRRSPG